jgi:hypothetical protein
LASAQVKPCGGGTETACDGLKKNLAHLEQVSPSDKAAASEAGGRVASCRGKGESDPECKSIADLLGKMHCK